MGKYNKDQSFEAPTIFLTLTKVNNKIDMTKM